MAEKNRAARRQAARQAFLETLSPKLANTLEQAAANAPTVSAAELRADIRKALVEARAGVLAQRLTQIQRHTKKKESE